MKASCQNCRFFHPEITSEPDNLVLYAGECRSAPPVVIVVDYHVVGHAWPPVRTEFWCRSWQSESGEVL
jgi:hypothetical protein